MLAKKKDHTTIYLYGIVDGMMLTADITSFRLFPELVNTSST
jgi:hypothetical protein